MLRSIQFKLWFAFVAMLCLSLSATFALTHWRFKNAFLEYVNQHVQSDAETIAAWLVNSYHETRGWKKLVQPTNGWRSKCTKALAPYRVLESQQAQLPVPRPPQLGTREFCRNLILLSAKGKILAGKKQPRLHYRWLDLELGGKPLGKIGYTRRSTLINIVDRLFVQQHRIAFIMIGVGVFVLASILSLWMSRRFTQPIRDLSHNAQELSRGNFDVNIKQSGHDEVSILCDNFNKLAETLKANLQARQKWLADISHEMRTPIAVIQAQLEAMADGVRPASPENLELINDKISGLKRLIDDLHELTLTDRGALSYRKQSVAIFQTVADAKASYETRIEEKGIELNYTNSLRLEDRVLGDPARLQQLFMNLLENALRYTDAPGKIVISASRSNSEANIIIEDSAPGVPDESLEKLFERLYRVESSRNRNTGGSGLGLSICQNIVEAHFGTIRAEHSQFGGVKMSISLPIQR